MKQPYVNSEERIDRFVGRRRAMADSLQTGMELQKMAAQLHKSLDIVGGPKACIGSKPTKKRTNG
jgi:hypothetical protein